MREEVLGVEEIYQDMLGKVNVYYINRHIILYKNKE